MNPSDTRQARYPTLTINADTLKMKHQPLPPLIARWRRGCGYLHISISSAQHRGCCRRAAETHLHRRIHACTHSFSFIRFVSVPCPPLVNAHARVCVSRKFIQGCAEKMSMSRANIARWLLRSSYTGWDGNYSNVKRFFRRNFISK